MVLAIEGVRSYTGPGQPSHERHGSTTPLRTRTQIRATPSHG